MLPAALRTSLQQILGAEPSHVQLLCGGEINQVARIDAGPSSRSVVAKWRDDAPAQLFQVEASGLEALRATQTLRVPRVLAVSETTPFLVLEYIEQRPPADAQQFTRRFAAALAKLHQSPTATPRFGWAHDNFIGILPQHNAWRETWPEFYRDCRLLPQIEIARHNNRLTPQREASLMQIADNLERALQRLSSRPALLHGDLWSGNYITDGDEPVVIDPAAYYGEREMEIAFIELFGGFPAGFVDAYNDVYPLQDGYEERRPLHQLYPLLVHLNHFGETYGPRVDRACEMCRTALL